MEISKLKVVIIYHCKDMDGLLSATLLNEYFKQYNDVTLVPYNYETENVDFIDNQLKYIQEFDKIIFVDVTPSIQWMENFVELVQEYKCDLTIIDHHEKQLKLLIQSVGLSKYFLIKNNKYSNFPKTKGIPLSSVNMENYNIDSAVYYDDSNCIEFLFSFIREDLNLLPVSAAWLSYLYVIYNLSVNENLNRSELNKFYNICYFVWLVSEYDIWNFNQFNYDKEQKQNVLNFQLEINEYIKENLNLQNYNSIIIELRIILFLHNDTVNQFIGKTIDTGSLIYEARLENQKFKTNYFLTHIDDQFNTYHNKNFIIVIGEYPEYIAQEWFKQKYDDISALIFMKIKPDENLVTMSIRHANDLNFNCIDFVQYLTGAGGGHFAASGGAIKHHDLINFFNIFSQEVK